MPAPEPSRIAAARHRAATTKHVLAAAAVTLFAALLVGARASHPGTSSAATPAGPTASRTLARQSFAFGRSDIAPAPAGPAPGASQSTNVS